MAITWKITHIVPIDIVRYIASITAVRDDGAGNIRTYTVPKAKIETAEQQQVAMQEILSMRAADKVKTDALAAFIDSRKAAGKIYLEANDRG